MYLWDGRDYQIVGLTSLLVLGLITRDWSLQAGPILALFAGCLTTQYLGALSNQPQPGPVWLTLKSAVITALGLSLLLRTNHVLPLMVAAVGAIASKFILRVGDKHIFNPANFGIMITLVLTQHAWVSPGQWGTEAWLVALFLGLGGLVLKRVGRWDTSLVFLGTYAALEIARNAYLGWSWDVVLHRLTNGSLLLFAFFMITDPRSIPNARTSRIVWASSIALLTFGLRNYWYVSTAPFWALFFFSPITIVLDRLWQSPRFTWTEAVLSQRPLSVG